MTDTAKKPATKRAPAKKAPAAKAEKPAPAKPKKAAPSEGAVIRLNPRHHRCPVRGNANGQRFEVPLGKDVTVSDAVLEALTNSHARFDIVSLPDTAGEGADEGSSAPSTSDESAPPANEGAEGADAAEGGEAAETPAA
jgi:hypothetical protein